MRDGMLWRNPEQSSQTIPKVIRSTRFTPERCSEIRTTRISSQEKAPRNNNSGGCRDNQDGNKGSRNRGGSGDSGSGGVGMAGGGDPDGGGGGASPPEAPTETTIPEGQGGDVDQISTPLRRWLEEVDENEMMLLGIESKPFMERIKRILEAMEERMDDENWESGK